jgi:xyloglucan-specific exo-beta-1,4-glucanase
VATNVAGWGTSNFTGRTISVTVNGAGAAVTTVGAALPAKGASDYYHFNSSAGSLSYSSVYWW